MSKTYSVRRPSSHVRRPSSHVRRPSSGVLRLLFAALTIATLNSTRVLANDGRRTSSPDSVRTDTVRLRPVDVQGARNVGSLISTVDDVQNGVIYAAKKTELVPISQMTVNASTNNARQVFSTVAGLNIWESDGAGIQLGIGGRGLSPDRTSNFTTRQNGYDISADPLGYPESYYTPPIEALERIEIVRGGGALRYGTQFGGMVNFLFRRPTTDAAVQARARVTGGSYGFASTFLDVNGTVDNVQYDVFYQFKRGDGWRPNSEFDMHTAYASTLVEVTDKLRISADYTYMSYLAHQPGGLTDKMFEDDPSQSVRARNWFTVNWNLASLRLDLVLSEFTTIRSLFFGNLSSRSALGNLDRINMADLGGPRTLIAGDFHNLGNETTITHDLELFGHTSTIVGGIRLFSGNTTQQQGLGSDSTDADFTFTNPDQLEGSDYTFPNSNAAIFAEGLIDLGAGFSVVPGIRMEHITTRADGWYRIFLRDLAGNVIVDSMVQEERSRSRNIVLGGVGLSYKGIDGIELYGNASQNFRSITFSDLRITNPNLIVDPNITDERGYTLDLGARGRIGEVISFDASLFYLRYNDRIGEILRADQPPLYQPYRYRTNVADAYTTGVEAVVEVDVVGVVAGSATRDWGVRLLVNGSLIDGQYLAPDEPTIDGNDVEFVPPYTLRTTLNIWWNDVSLSLMSAWVGQQFTDASNAEYTASAVSGIVPAYNVWDVSASWTFNWLRIEASCNNIFGASYFTRRAVSYPGPGIIPAEPRSVFLTVQVNGDIITR